MNRDKTEITVQTIRGQYAEKNAAEMELDLLCKLDAEVKKPANTFAYTFGTVGSLIMGTGMCYAMEVLGKKKQISGVILGIIGMTMICGNYPIYKKLLAKRKEKYADVIIELSDKIMDDEHQNNKTW